jgi:hypothetical protein
MKTLKFVAACAFGLTVLIAAASAQMGMGMRPSMPSGIFSPVVGAGAAYDMTSSDGKTTSMEYALVGKEAVNGKDGYWMETTTTGGHMGQMVMKILIVPGADPPNARMIMQMGKNPPMEMTQMMHGGSAAAKPNLDVRQGGQDLGKESITVPAGTFTCEHYRSSQGGDVWVSSQVPSFGMVKSSNNGMTMVLTKVLTGAKDKITGTPVPFNPQLMMQGMQNQ